MKSPIFVGVDVSKATLEIAIEGEPSSLQLENAAPSIRRWLKDLKEPCSIGVESTGSYHRALTRLALGAGHTVYVLNSRDLSHYARALGRRAKTDRLDAQLIARYLSKEHSQLHPYRLPTQLQEELDGLIKRRHTLVVAQGMLKQSFSALSLTTKTLAQTLRMFKKLIDELDARMQELIDSDPALAPIAQNLDTVVGFGPLLSHALAIAITRHPFKHADAFIAFVGYDPRARDSGQQRGRRYLSKRGPAELRRLLFNAAMSASKTSLWRPFYDRYRARGFSSTATLVILARKLARIAFSIVKHGTVFQPELIENACAKP